MSRRVQNTRCSNCGRLTQTRKKRCYACQRHWWWTGVERGSGLPPIKPRAQCPSCGGYRSPSGKHCVNCRQLPIRWGVAHHAWKGDAASEDVKRNRAQRRYPLGRCVDCGRPAVDRHHLDDDPGNNAPENVVGLCRRCHMVRDGRLERLTVLAKANSERQRAGPKPCVHCGRLFKPLRKGLCGACERWQRTHGTPRPLALEEARRYQS